MWTKLAGVNGCMAVAMGALAAHATADFHLASVADRASIYQLVHAALLVILAECPGRAIMVARWLILAGIMLFCGTLYLKALLGLSQATALAPLGGMCLMSGWLMMVFAGATRK